MPEFPGDTYPLAGRTVARIGFGAMQLSRRAPDADAAASVLRHALAGGVDHVDTAEFYGDGFVNDVIRRVVGRDEGVLVATKVGATPDPAGPLPLRAAQRPAELRASVEDNLRSLGRDHLPLVYLRRMDAGPGIRPEGDQRVPLEDQLAAMTAMRDEGLIGAIGISAVESDGLRRALPVGIAAVQNAYSLVDRHFDELLALTSREAIPFVSFFPLGSGFPGHPKVAGQPAVTAMAARMGVSPAQIGLAWLLHRSPNSLVIPGTARVEHLDENLAACSVRLDDDAIAELDGLQVTGTGEIRWVGQEG
jgi:pyridoxine 4-dehydrogenase